MYYYLANFLLFSILGSCFEQMLKLLFFHDMKSGILSGPFVPVYGFGIIIIILVNNFVFKRFSKEKNWKKYSIIFLIVLILLTSLEWLGGTLIELIFNKTMWNYKEIPLHIGKYIAVPISLLWGVGAISYLKFIKKHTDLFIKKIPKQLVYLVFLLFLICNFYTFFLKKLIR